MRSVSDRLNRECFCITLDREQLRHSLGEEMGEATVAEALVAARPHLFSNTPVFLAQEEIAQMLRTVRAIETVAALAPYREHVLSWAPPIAQHDPGPRGVFMGYDFHLTEAGPKLIEINTNAGGAFLNALLVRAQRTCCTEVDVALGRTGGPGFEAAALSMFEGEWLLQRGAGRPERIAIVDDSPEEQYLYPEFVLARRLFEKNGLSAQVADAVELRYDGTRLTFRGEPLDLLYNRLVDFELQRSEHAALRAAYLDGAIVLTPNPHVHAMFADKRNLTVLSDAARLRSWGVEAEVLAALEGVPHTVLVTLGNASDLWAKRKSLFFKPACGYGSKAVYRGDKVTKGVWAEICGGGFVAQEFAAPSERMVRVDGVTQARKTDVRLYIYAGQLLLTAARLYQGQATNFRTPGGGFAPLLAL